MKPYLAVITIIIVAIILIMVIYLLYTGMFVSLQPVASNQSGKYLVLTTDLDIMIVNIDRAVVQAQLYENGVPVNQSGVNISFNSDNDSIGRLDTGRLRATNENGVADIGFCSKETPGLVKITASCLYNGSMISNYTFIDARTPCSIAGLALDKNGKGISNADVSCWRCKYNASTKKWDNIALVQHALSIQYSADGRNAPTGMFSFYLIPSDVYNVSVDKDGHSNYTIVNADQGTVTCTVKLDDYGYQGNTTQISPPSPTSKGIIWGVIVDQNKVAIGNAEVSLWRCEYDPASKVWENKEKVAIPNNPQLSSTESARVGTYKFYDVPPGTYNVTAEFLGLSYYAIAHQDNNVSTNFVVVHNLW